MERTLPLVLLAAHLGLAALVTLATARRHRVAWRARGRHEAGRGYRDPAHREVHESLAPPGLLPHAGGAVALGSVGLWPALWAALRALGVEHGAPAAPIDLRALAAAGFALLLGAVAAAALRLVARAASASASARGIGGAAVALGALVALPVIAWPRWFGADAGAAGALGLLLAVAGALLLRSAGLAEAAELELSSRPPLFDEA